MKNESVIESIKKSTKSTGQKYTMLKRAELVVSGFEKHCSMYSSFRRYIRIVSPRIIHSSKQFVRRLLASEIRLSFGSGESYRIVLYSSASYSIILSYHTQSWVLPRAVVCVAILSLHGVVPCWWLVVYTHQPN